MEEIWKPLPTNPEFEISNKGRVRKIKYIEPTTQRYSKCRIGKRVRYIHRLVAEAFFDDYAEHLTVNHKDGDRLNNNVDNLEMMTFHENILHAIDMKKSK